jgi:hypothetical protein
MLFSDINENSFLDRLSNNIQISNFIQIRPLGAELFRTDRRTDRPDEDNSRFSHIYERA